MDMNLIIGNIALAQLPMDLIGMVVIGFIASGLVLMWLAFLVWRFRARMLAQASASGHKCPRCHSPLRRIHRTRWERVLCTLMKLSLGHYRCSNRHCSWQGLLPVQHEHHHKVVPASAASSGELASAASNPGSYPQPGRHLPGAHIETGTVPLPSDDLPVTELQPVHEIEGGPLIQA